MEEDGMRARSFRDEDYNTRRVFLRSYPLHWDPQSEADESFGKKLESANRTNGRKTVDKIILVFRRAKRKITIFVVNCVPETKLTRLYMELSLMELTRMNTEELLKHRMLKFRSTGIGGFKEGSEVEPERKRNMKPSEVNTPKFADLESELEAEIKEVNADALRGSSLNKERLENLRLQTVERNVGVDNGRW